MQRRQILHREQIHGCGIECHHNFQVTATLAARLEAILFLFALLADIAQRFVILVGAERALETRIGPAGAARPTAQAALAFLALNLGQQGRAAAQGTLAAPPVIQIHDASKPLRPNAQRRFEAVVGQQAQQFGIELQAGRRELEPPPIAEGKCGPDCREQGAVP